MGVRTPDQSSAAMPGRPMVRWFGGKWRQAPTSAAHFPPHRVYVEPFGGAASVLVRKPRSAVEVLNDLDDELLRLYRVLRDPALALRLEYLLLLTPYHRREYALAFEPCDRDDWVEVARRVVVRGAMGYGTGLDKGLRRATGYRDCSRDGRTVPAHDWPTYADAITCFTERLQGVIMESRDAVDVMRCHDGASTLHYVDPPYVRETRQGRRGYAHDLDDAGHVRLIEAVRGLRGHVVVSGYRCALYDEALADWRRVDHDAVDQGRERRVESVWISPSCDAATPVQLALAFDESIGRA